jgi:signal transduction histidine kinase
LILACAAVSATAIMADATRDSVVSVRTLAMAYAAQSALAAAMVRRHTGSLGSWPLVLHLLDIAWAATLTAATNGPNSPLFVLYLFCLLGAAYRWGLPETVLTGVASLALFTAEAGLPVHQLFGSRPPRFDLQAVLMRGTYLIMGAIVLGYVAEEEQLHHAETTIVGRVLARVQAETGFRPALRYVVSELLDVFEAKQLIVVAEESDSGRAGSWQASRPDGELILGVGSGELRNARRAMLHFPSPGDTVRIVRTRNGCDLLSLDAEGRVLGKCTWSVPDAFWSSPQYRAAAVVNVSFADRWTGRVLLMFDRAPGVAEVRLVQRLICHATPVMYSHYLLRRLRSRVAATERLRLARELHDTVIQSLAGLEMHMAALRRRRERELRAAGVDDELARLQQLLAEEARATRELMHQIRPLEIGRGQIVWVFADLVARFERESGIEARFSADVDAAEIPARTARELGRTLQEALRNVRKHSGARHVDVTFTTDDGRWKLVVANDGRPFDFTGRWTLEQLDAQVRGPRVIKERVREMGGDLAIESTPAEGVRLEVTVPRARRMYA